MEWKIQSYDKLDPWEFNPKLLSGILFASTKVTNIQVQVWVLYSDETESKIRGPTMGVLW